MLLEFEKPIVELEEKLAGMKELAKDSEADVTDAIKTLEKKIVELKKETFQNLTRWQRVELSRHPERPYTLDYIYGLTDDFIELHGDRSVRDDKAMVGGLGTIEESGDEPGATLPEYEATADAKFWHGESGRLS